MNKTEFAKFAMALRTYYSKENLLPTDAAMELWYRELEDIPYDKAALMLRKWVATQKWSPSISEIRKGVTELLIPETGEDWSTGWQKVLNAVGRYGYMRGDEALASFDPITAETIRRIGWNTICNSENLSVDRASFRQVYEIISTRAKETQQLPRAVRDQITAPAVQKLLSGIGAWNE